LFVSQATASPDKAYLFDMLPLPAIVPRFDNPSTVLNACKGHLFRNLGRQRGFPADVALLHTLVALAATLKVVGYQHPLERDVFHLYDRVDEALRQCMNSNSMDVPLNVTRALGSPDTAGTDASVIVRQAMAFLDGPLKLCLQHDLTGLLGTAQVSNHVRTVFAASLRPTRTRVVRQFADLFQTRSGCATLRYRPAFMFFLLFFSKVAYLVLVAAVAAVGDCAATVAATGPGMAMEEAPGQPPQCVPHPGLTAYERCIVSMLLTSLLYAVGDMVDRGGVLAHAAQAWNMLDLARDALVGLWLLCRLSLSAADGALIHIASGGSGSGGGGLGRAFLAISAVPMSIGLLRFLSIFKQLGQLVVMIFAMSKELVSFLVVFLMSILGFGIAFHSLFPDVEGFRSSGATVLTLFDAALGGHEFQPFRGHTYEDVGVAVMIVYVVFVVIILLNLIIARMTVRSSPPPDPPSLFAPP
jgi:hypothetical protein